jgi:hypothetical protein
LREPIQGVVLESKENNPVKTPTQTHNPHQGMTASDWHNILRCARLRKEQFGTSLRWPSMSDYHRYQREYDTYVMAGAMAARANRLAG